MKTWILIVYCLMVALAGCAPVNHLSMSVLTSRVAAWDDGAPVQADSAHGVAMRMNYEGYTDAGLVYKVQCTNRSGAPYTVDPTMFTVHGVTPREIARGAETEARTVHAYSFMRGLRAIDSTIQNQKDRMTAGKVVVTILVVAVVVATVFVLAPALAKQSGKGRDYRSSGRSNYGYGYGYGYVGYYHPIYRSGRGQQSGSSNRGKARLQALKTHRDNFNTNGLQMHTLAPGESITGQILIPRLDKASALRMEYAVGDSVMHFEYLQSVVPNEEI